MTRWLWLTAAGLLVAAFGLRAALDGQAVRHTHPATGANVQFAIAGNAALQPGACVRVTWAVEGVSGLLLDGTGRSGAGSDEHCGVTLAYRPHMRVHYTDGTTQEFELRQRMIWLDTLVTFVAVSAAALLLAGLYRWRRSAAVTAAGLMVVAAVAGLVMLTDPVTRLGLHLVGGVALALLFAGLRRDLADGAWLPAWVLFGGLLLIPALLYSVPGGLLASGAAAMRPAGMIAAVVVYGVPLLTALALLRSPAGAFRQHLMNALAALFGGVLMLALLEGGLRLVAPPADDTPAQPLEIGVPMAEDAPTLRPDTEWYHQYPSNERGYFDADNRIYYRTNAAGFRDEPFTRARQPGVARVALLGDSFAMGVGVRFEDTAAVVMEQTLRDEYGCAVEVYNFGVSSHNLEHYPRVTREVILDYEPDVLLVWYFLNDIGMDKSMFYEEALQQRNPFFPLGRLSLRTAAFASSLLQQRVQVALGEQQFHDNYSNPARWQAAQTHLAEVAALARENDIRYGLYTHPVLYRLNDNHPYAPLHEQVLTAAADMGYFTDDLLAALWGEPYYPLWVHAQDSHPNEIAHRLTGEYAADQLALVLPACDAG